MDEPRREPLLADAEACLAQRDPDAKVFETWRVAARILAGDRLPARRPAAHRPPRPGLPPDLRLVDPLAVPKRKLGTRLGRAAFVHAIAHIEFNAINLAWDCVCRFADMPAGFYRDWAQVAEQEATHFCLLRERLRELGHDYGDFEAHSGLWDMADKTGHDVLARMAMVPRVLEARGLDVTPALIGRLAGGGDERTASILRLVLEEEVGHVAAGSCWFRYECDRRGIEMRATFRRLLLEYTGRSTLKGPLNREHRRRAGFCEAEIADLQQP